ncbi:hypothetical protein [Galactobacter valiniphilus]|uniref:hypothetical protein n=1 Tax=Galactobacter valiniphilus TaxID=2676122 RepID=UPI003736E3F3
MLPPTSLRGTHRAVAGLGLAVALSLSACSGTTAGAPAPAQPSAAAAGSQAPSSEASGGTQAGAPASTGGVAQPSAVPTAASSAASGAPSSAGSLPDAEDDPASRAIEDFKAWVATVNDGNAAKACRYLSAKQAQKMVDELAAGGSDARDCAGMITMTSRLYAAAGHRMVAEVEVRRASPTSVTLWVDYDGDCGLVVMEPGNGHWVINEQSQEQC